MTRLKSLQAMWNVVAIALCLLIPCAHAHDARPLSINVLEQTPGVYRAVVRAPPVLDADNLPRVLWPESCDIREAAPLRYDAGGTSLISCPGGLGGRVVAIDYPLYNPSISTLLRLQSETGVVRTALLPPDTLEWQVPAEPDRLTVARDYVVLGFKHIWEGPDHLLFVAGLMLLARRPRRIVIAVTGFTAAHSITLSAAALDFIRVPIAPVEAMIALSILFLAAELARGDTSSFSHRYPIALSFVFGLLHGFGFASALGELGLPDNEVGVALVCFNVGVELGQLAFIAGAGCAMLVWSRVSAAMPAPRGLDLSGRAALVGAYVLGIPSAFWVFERAGAIVSA